MLFLSFIAQMGPREIQQLVAHFGCAEKVIASRPDDWANVLGYPPAQADVWKRSLFDAEAQAKEECEQIVRENIQIVLRSSEEYPELLHHIACPPPFLYVRGEIKSGKAPVIAIVGSRRCSYYGEKVARMLTTGLTRAGMICVSGLARGIDRIVHEATLEAGGKTWAVLGHGLSTLYPAENKDLARVIEKEGALISEFSMGTKPFRGNFPRRNRIVAGVAWATLVIEGTIESGSLITARLAAQEGRDVFAVPGLITSELAGAPHRLIQMGAKLIHTLEDILSEVPQQFKVVAKLSTNQIVDNHVAEEFKEIWNMLSDSPVSRELLIDKLNRDASTLLISLTKMEMEGLIKKLPGDLLVRA